jgi:hypothetical protein
MYRTARAERAKQHRVVGDHSASPDAKSRAGRQRWNAENQMRLLENPDTNRGYSDFYTYRYLASEGFLPGYSFPRLPIAAFVPGRQVRVDGSYIQRARFLAINEFGPGALIYHEGTQYQVKRAQLPMSPYGEGGIPTSEARRCTACGYHNESSDEICANCHARLAQAQLNLMQLQTVFTVRRERISSDEEERRRAGFDREMSYRFNDHGSRPGKLVANLVDEDGEMLAELIYGDTATIRVTNLGRRLRKNKNDLGFVIDTMTGEWLADNQDPSHAVADLRDIGEANQIAKVIPYVEDRRNILVLRPAQRLGTVAMTSMRYALERGIETVFQLEDVELNSEPLPNLNEPNRMIFVESSEGGAGVLRRLLSERKIFAEVATVALDILHFDSQGNDTHLGRGDDRCEKGCYECLLSYGNQYEHELINRQAVVALLKRFATAEAVSTGATSSPSDHASWLTTTTSGDVRRDFLGFLRTHHYRIPDATDEWIDGAAARPDLVYKIAGGATAVFVDLPQEKYLSTTGRDDEAEERLIDIGWHVVRIGHDEDWESAVRRHRSVFGTGRAGR